MKEKKKKTNIKTRRDPLGRVFVENRITMGPKGTETKEVVLGHDKLANVDVLTNSTQDDRG